MMRMQSQKTARSIFLLITLIFLGQAMGYAQFKVYGKVTTQENKKYHGEVITYEPQKSVTLNCQGDTLTFDLTREEFKFTTRTPPKRYNFPLGLGYHRISLGPLVGTTNEGSFISYSYHHQNTARIGYGGGLSYEDYGDEDGYQFLVLRGMFISYLKETNSTPYLKLDAGYGYAIKDTGASQTSAKGGLNLGATVGFRLSTNRVMVDFEAGVRGQNGNYEFDFGDFLREDDIFFKRFVVGIGFMW